MHNAAHMGIGYFQLISHFQMEGLGGDRDSETWKEASSEGGSASTPAPKHSCVWEKRMPQGKDVPGRKV